MNFSILKCLTIGTIIAMSSANYDCNNRRCFLTTNIQNEVIFDCAEGKSENDNMVMCSFLTPYNKIILSTKDRNHIPIDKIAKGAFLRLTSGIVVDKILINNLQFKNLNRDDFDGLTNVLEMRIENPESLASDTFLSLASRTKYFILTISCIQGNAKNSFDSLLLMSDKWRLYTENCYKKLSCKYSNCNTKTQSTMSKITSSETVTGRSFQISFQACAANPVCINEKIVTPAPTESTEQVRKEGTLTTVSRESKEELVKKETLIAVKAEQFHDTLMSIVLVLTSVNSVVILGILVFLIIWWNKLATSTNNNKHTIILDDEDDSNFLKSPPYH